MTTTLIEKITADVNAEIAAIDAAADQEIQIIERDSAAAINAVQEAAATALTKQKRQTELVMLAKAEQVANISKQSAKRAAIDGLLQTVSADVLAETGEAYVTRYTNKAKTVLPAEFNVTHVAAPADKLAETKEILAALTVTVAPTATALIKAGLIFTTDDGVYDVSFERIMSDVRPQLEMELAASVA